MRSIQSPGVEIREFDFSLRPASVEGTTVFVAGFSPQGPIDEVLQPTSIQEWEQIYGYPTNSAEQYFYQTAKTLFTSSPAKVLATRLPYGYGKGDGFNNWRYSALVYPAVSYKSTPAFTTQGVAQSITVKLTDETNDVSNWSTLRALSGLAIGLGLSGTGGIQLLFSVNGAPALSSVLTNPPYTPYVIPVNTSSALDNPGEVGNVINQFWATNNILSSNFDFSYTTSNNYILSLTFSNKQKAAATQSHQVVQARSIPGFVVDVTDYTQGVNPQSVPYTGGQEVTDTLGFSGGNVYFFGTPTYIELTQEQYTQITTENIEWLNKPTTSHTSSKPFNFNTIAEAGMIILNKSQVSNNNNYEGYYVGIVDNNNFNPATPYNGINRVLGIQDKSVENLGSLDYTLVPQTRLNFPLSAGRVGDGNSISELMENLTEFDLGNSDFDDTITIGVFKLRKSVYAPDTVTLDFVLSESIIGSLDYRRQIADKNANVSKPFYVGTLAENTLNTKILVNPWISNQYSDTWIGNDGKPTKKVRFLSRQLITPFRVPGNVDTAETYATRIGAPSASVEAVYTSLGTTDSLFPLGVYTDTQAYTKNVGQLPLKLERAFDLVENSDIYPMNIAVEAGLGTIYVNAISMTDPYGTTENVDVGPYIDNKPLPSLSAWYKTNAFLDYNDVSDPLLGVIGTNMRANYTAVANVFVTAAEKRRKDFIVVLDPLRQIFIQGANTKTISTKRLYSPNAGIDPTPYAPGFVTTNFSQHIYWPLRHQFNTINSSYATIYANWVQVLDGQSNRQIWVPFSGFAAAAMANTDFNFNPWQAPAGFTRGILTNVNDIAIYPRQNQRDQLYKAAFNPVTFFPGEGFVIFGQKTSLKKPSAFDRINVRRLFLYLETVTKNTLKYFVFEPNTLFTRTQVINTLTPIFDQAKNSEGIYDYLIVCDERNNTPDVIDNNELKIDIYIKPVRTAEFILVSFYATRTAQNFQELVGG